MRISFALASLPVLALALAGCGSAPAASEEVAESAQAWDAQSVTDETRSSHLWVVERGVDLLVGRAEAASKKAVRLMENATCATNWRQGLYDADFLDEYNNSSTWVSHFYDPGTGTNYLGTTFPTARGSASTRLTNARRAWASGNLALGCYQLGLALHYMTDSAQPMHAANFSALSKPIYLHGNAETRAMAIQAAYVRKTLASAPTVTNADTALVNAAKTAKSLFSPTMSAVTKAYRARCGIALPAADITACWSGDAGVDAQLGAALSTAQESTAKYLFAVASDPAVPSL
jgi:phospholipase C